MKRLRATARHHRAIAARLALVAVLVMAAFAHRAAPPTPSGMTLAEIAQYVLPDGSLPVLCLPGEDGHVTVSHCEFCLIAGAASLAAEPECSAPSDTWRDGAPIAALQTGPPVRTIEIATRPLRGPPLASV